MFLIVLLLDLDIVISFSYYFVIYERNLLEIKYVLGDGYIVVYKIDMDFIFMEFIFY